MHTAFEGKVALVTGAVLEVSAQSWKRWSEDSENKANVGNSKNI